MCLLPLGGVWFDTSPRFEERHVNDATGVGKVESPGRGSGPEKLSVVNVTRAKVCVRRKRQLNGPNISYVAGTHTIVAPPYYDRTRAPGQPRPHLVLGPLPLRADLPGARPVADAAVQLSQVGRTRVQIAGENEKVGTAPVGEGDERFEVMEVAVEVLALERVVGFAWAKRLVQRNEKKPTEDITMVRDPSGARRFGGRGGSMSVGFRLGFGGPSIY